MSEITIGSQWREPDIALNAPVWTVEGLEHDGKVRARLDGAFQPIKMNPGRFLATFDPLPKSTDPHKAGE